MDQPFVFLFFRGLKGFAALIVGMFAGHDTAPGNAHPGHFAHSYGAGFGKKPCNFLVTAPVRAFDRIVKMHFRAVAFTHDGIAQRCLHTAHCSG